MSWFGKIITTCDVSPMRGRFKNPISYITECKLYRGGCGVLWSIRIEWIACICGCYDWSHAPVLFAARRAGSRPVILILHIIDAVASPARRQKTCPSVKGETDTWLIHHCEGIMLHYGANIADITFISSKHFLH